MEERVRCLQDRPGGPGPVVYWMSREQRVRDNWGLLFARNLAATRGVPLQVVFCLADHFLGATWRQYDFMLQGLRQVEGALRTKNISFHLLRGEVETTLIRYLQRREAAALVTDFDPLRIKRRWRTEVGAQAPCPAWEVDGHNVVPCWVASPKLEYGAYTLRPKINRLLSKFLCDIPALPAQPQWDGEAAPVDWKQVGALLAVDRTVLPVAKVRSGEAAAWQTMEDFLAQGLARYPEQRNNPALAGQSGLSPYFHFGQISPQRVAWQVLQSDAPGAAKESFLEELIIRRELADNFCWYQPQYDTVEAFPAWARETLAVHASDMRPYRYSPMQLDQGLTHDELWNGAQRQLTGQGTMHGYLRMYWAKKILEWSDTPAAALATAITLNDRYQLDGRDPNGYAGIAWSIGGVHDRAWPTRPIFGKIRYMSYNGAKGKFDIGAYLHRIAEKEES